ncbi:MAG: DNA phosphorothioation-dependent restriction protein DptF [Cellvibrionaceae bacterium]
MGRNIMDLREALGLLSKASPYAVTTSGGISDPKLRAIKDYLYIDTEVEKVFRNRLESVRDGDIIFLCGSSGDGKSEILTRYDQEYGDDVDFHLDATHSFQPEDTAIDTLNQVFSRQKASSRPLVVGINIGMLANYEREGSNDHQTIKSAIAKFLPKASIYSVPDVEQKYSFINFEAFPKFSIAEDRISSKFFSMLLNRVVVDDQGNNFRDLFNASLGLCDQNSAGIDTKRLVSNYLMLRDRGVQRVVVELLLNARIRQDQFITARMLLDFIYCILTGEKYLFDNLFEGGDNEILQALSEFDPSVKRDKALDQFVLNRSLNIDDKSFKQFRSEAKDKFKVDSRGKVNVQSLVRQLFILRYTKLESAFPNNFTNSFSDYAGRKYREIWSLVKNYSGDGAERKVIRRFYEDIVFSAIGYYANRNAPYLSKGELYLSTHGLFDVASEAELTIEYKRIENDPCADIHSFNLHMAVNDEPLDAFPLNINLLSLLINVVAGYRPNKHDKNSVVLLDELVNHIRVSVGRADTLFLFKYGERIAKVKQTSDEEIRVGNLRL